MSTPQVTEVTTASYRVPTDAAEGDGTATWDATGVVLAFARSGDVTGTGWTYGPSACAALIDDLLQPVVVGADAYDIPSIWQAMVRAARNSTRAGAVGYGISAVDVALWDLKARLLDLPLADLFGIAQPHVPVYGSGGFTTYNDDQTTQQLTEWVHGLNIGRVKIKIGQDRGTRVDRDVERIELARNTIGAGNELYVDANGAYTAKQAIRLYRATQGLDVSWFEEPVSSDDLAGLSQVRRAVEADVAAGEYGTDVGYFQQMTAAQAVDCLQVDATRCGGYTEWFRAAAVAAGHQLEVSAHCAPNLHAHAAAATHNRRHIEWFHDHTRIESVLFDGALDPTGGTVTPDRTQPGHGLTLRAEEADRFEVAS